MPVYVDPPHARFGRMVMCHMVADTPSELHAMADQIGIKRRWFQDDPRRPHYDICKSKRALAIAAGAEAVTARELITVLRRARLEQWFSPQLDQFQ